MADIKQTTIEPALDRNADCIRDVVTEDKNHKEEVKNNRCYDAVLLNTCIYTKTLQIFLPCTTRTLIPVLNSCEMLRNAEGSKFSQDSPQQIMTDGVKCLCKVDEGSEKVRMFSLDFCWRRKRPS